MSVLRDLFAGPGNASWDLGRIIGTLAFLSVLAALAYTMAMGLPVDLGVTGFPGGLAAVITAIAAFIAAKDYARAANITAQKGEGS